jgi:hypothetical protein
MTSKISKILSHYTDDSAFNPENESRNLYTRPDSSEAKRKAKAAHQRKAIAKRRAKKK